MTGFANLTKQEQTVLLAFQHSPSIAYPIDCGLSRQEIANGLTHLKQKNLVTGKAPYQLTKQGKLILAELLRSNT